MADQVTSKEKKKIKKEELGPRLESLGNKHTKDSRKLQAYYRKIFLQEKCGNGPRKNDRELCSMLKNGEVTGSNFINNEIFRYAKERVHEKKAYETIEEYRLFNNMLSSQPMCFNLFVPLRNALMEGNTFVHQIFKALFPELKIKTITKIEIEYIPHYYKELINDKTALDAFVEYITIKDEIGIIGIETKYTDKLGKNKGSNTRINIDLSDVIKPNTLTSLGNEGFNQLFRNILFTESYRKYNNIHYSLNIILSSQNEPSTEKELEEVKDIFAIDPSLKIQKKTLEDFVDVIKEFCPSKYYESWINAFYDRYLNYDLLNNIE